MQPIEERRWADRKNPVVELLAQKAAQTKRAVRYGRPAHIHQEEVMRPLRDDELWMIGASDPIDDGIIGPVRDLRDAGIDTFSSCDGHGRVRPSIWFNGESDEGKKAEKIATNCGWLVYQVALVSYTRQDERTTYWEISFVNGAAHQ